ncbi:MAG: hypothetical protein AAGF04_04405 [Chlamydiota bacterium]
MSLNNISTVVIITSSAGGGHITGAEAVRKQMQRECLEGESFKFVMVDLLEDWLPGFMGKYFARRWNLAQIRGNVASLHWMANRQRFIDALLFLSVYYSCSRMLRTLRPDRFVDTQPLATGAIMRAICRYNATFRRHREKELCLEKVMTDPPTQGATHFLSRIRRLTDSQRSLVRVMSIRPLLKNGESNADFWKKRAGLDESQVKIVDHFAREEFFPYIKCQEKISQLFFALDLDQVAYLSKALQGSAQYSFQKTGVSLTLKNTDLLFLFLLGTNPPEKALIAYLSSLAEVCSHSNRTVHAVICCGSALNLPTEILTTFASLPSSLYLLPLPMQKAEFLAPLMHRSDLRVTKSGGSTTMELLATVRARAEKGEGGEIWIHSEEKQISGIAAWEKDNAAYLQQAIKQTKLVTPETCSLFLEDFFARLDRKKDSVHSEQQASHAGFQLGEKARFESVGCAEKVQNGAVISGKSRQD